MTTPDSTVSAPASSRSRKLIRIARNLGMFALCALGLFLVAHAVENWRAAREWNRFRAEVEARGEQLGIASIIPPEVPDSENVFTSPIFRVLTATSEGGTRWHPDSNSLFRLEVIQPDRRMGRSPSPKAPRIEPRRPIDWKAWQAFYLANTNYASVEASDTPARDVLKALSVSDTEFEEVRIALARPGSRYPLAYSSSSPFEILLPHVERLRGVARAGFLRSAAHLELGDGDQALRDLWVTLNASQALRNEPLLISYLVRCSLLDLGFYGIQRGLSTHAWKPNHLTEIEHFVAKLDLTAEFRQAMRGEQAFGSVTIETLRAKPGGPSGWDDGSLPVSLIRFIPSGWFVRNRTSLCMGYQRILADGVPRGRFHPEAFREVQDQVAKDRWSPYRIVASMLHPAIASTAAKAAKYQTLVRQVRTACALEKHYQKTGTFPEHLAEVVPAFLPELPEECVTDGILRYERTQPSAYRLISVGWDQKDDGGTVEPPRAEVKSGQQPTHDWVWQIPL